MLTMPLSDLLTAACRRGGTPGPLPLDAAARLYGAVANDLDDGRLAGNATGDAGLLPATVEETGSTTATVGVGGLRYLIELELGAEHDTVTALCVTPGCPNPALSRARLARVCDQHLGLVDELAEFLLNIPRAGDDRPDGWEEQAARDIRVMRLEAWQRELDADEQKTSLERGRLARIRDGR